jgi:tripartite-type tricarboxylate transporter receptor subunit TctC
MSITNDPMNRLLRSLAAALLAALAASTLHAQDASRPLKIVVPYAAGGTTDQVARLLQRPLSEILQQPVVVENKPGAAGTIGTELVARAAPDGNTLVFGNPAPNAFVPALRKTGYDPITDLRPISTVAVMPMLLVVPTASGMQTFRDFMQRARAPGANLNYGSSGIGSLAHLTGAYFAQRSKLDMVHIPYAGGAPMMSAMYQGDLQATFTTGLDGAAMVQSGRARYLAVASPQRIASLSSLPTIAEELPGFRSVVWFALFAPKGTPDPVVERLRTAVLAVLEKPEFKSYLAERHAEARGSTPQELLQLVRDDIAQWVEVVNTARIPM